MAQTILGVDLGAYSIKVAELEVSFRQTKLRAVTERKLLDPLPGELPLQRATRTLRGILAEREGHADLVTLALGDDAVLRLVDMPFNDTRKIDQVIGYELESQILGELDGMVVDQILAQPMGDGARVLAVGADRERLQELIAAMADAGAEPRNIGAAVLSYSALVQKGLPPQTPPEAPEGEEPGRAIDVVIDLGHRTTRIAFVEQTRTVFARGVGRGGAEITAVLAETYRLEEPAAERAKHAQAQLLPSAANEPDAARRNLDAVLREAYKPLVRELRQTFAAARAQGVPQPLRMALVGGAAKLMGLPQFLERELGVPLVHFEFPREITGEGPTGIDDVVSAPTKEIAGVALGLALGLGMGAGTQVNLRKGTLSYRSDYAYLRGKATYLGWAVVVLFACVGLNAFASLRAMNKEAEVLEARLKRETIDLFGTAKLDGRAVSEELRRGPQNGMPPVPAMTAYDLLDEISVKLPARDQVKLDIVELDIKPKKTFIKATASSAKEIDAIVEGLKQVECFGEIQRGKVASITGAPSGGGDSKDGKESKEKVELKQFTLTIESTCP
jgi:Tfp pilus assembly PilM family ATPase